MDVKLRKLAFRSSVRAPNELEAFTQKPLLYIVRSGQQDGSPAIMCPQTCLRLDILPHHQRKGCKSREGHTRHRIRMLTIPFSMANERGYLKWSTVLWNDKNWHVFTDIISYHIISYHINHTCHGGLAYPPRHDHYGRSQVHPWKRLLDGARGGWGLLSVGTCANLRHVASGLHVWYHECR